MLGWFRTLTLDFSPVHHMQDYGIFLTYIAYRIFAPRSRRSISMTDSVAGSYLGLILALP